MLGYYNTQSLKALAMSGLLMLNAIAPVIAAEPDPVFEIPVFNDPGGDEAAQYTIYQQLARLIDRVPAGQNIEMSWFEFGADWTTDTSTKPNIPTRLLSAHKRGVNIRIILDNNTKDDGSSNEQEPPYKTLSPILGTNDTASSYIVLCPDKEGCIGKRKLYKDTYAYNHNKFLLASQIVLNDKTTLSNIVFQSSGNLGSWDADTVWNNAMTWSEEASYADYAQYFKDLRDNRLGEGIDNYYRVGDTTEKYKTHFFPREETNGDLDQASTDTIVSILKDVKCSYVGNSDNQTHQTDIRVVMWSFSRVAVAEALADLVRDGCWVDIAYADMSDSVASALDAVDDGESIGITLCAVEHEDRTLKPHSKYMLIDGAYDDDQIPTVWMGSHNYAVSSLRSADESLVRIRDARIHGKYLSENFYRIRDTCSGKIKPGE
jgi:hypothetical protein